LINFVAATTLIDIFVMLPVAKLFNLQCEWKTCHSWVKSSRHNFGWFCWPIFKILSPLDSAENWLTSAKVIANSRVVCLLTDL